MKPLKFIISGGGTGGHIFPAIAIANAIARLHPQAEFLFVGAKGKKEEIRERERGRKLLLVVGERENRRSISN